MWSEKQPVSCGTDREAWRGSSWFHSKPGTARCDRKSERFFFINSFQFSNIPLHPFPTLFQRLFPGRIMFSIKAGLRQMLCRLCDTVPFWLGDSKLVVVQNIQSTHSIAGAIPLAFTCLYYTYIYRIRITTKYTTPFTEAFFLGLRRRAFPTRRFRRCGWSGIQTRIWIHGCRVGKPRLEGTALLGQGQFTNYVQSWEKSAFSLTHNRSWKSVCPTRNEINE